MKYYEYSMNIHVCVVDFTWILICFHINTYESLLKYCDLYLILRYFTRIHWRFISQSTDLTLIFYEFLRIFYEYSYNSIWINKRFSMNLFEYHWILINITESSINFMKIYEDLVWITLNLYRIPWRFLSLYIIYKIKHSRTWINTSVSWYIIWIHIMIYRDYYLKYNEMLY